MGQIYGFDEIQNGRPVISFGSLPDVSSSGKLNQQLLNMKWKRHI